jgi:hypothetical protein
VVQLAVTIEDTAVADRAELDGRAAVEPLGLDDAWVPRWPRDTQGMNTFEIWTDSEGRVLDPVETAIEQTVVAAVANGDVHPDAAEVARAELRGYAAAREKEAPAPISDDAYLDFARATGVLRQIDDPRVRRSWQ